MGINKIQNQFASIEQVTDQYLNRQQKAGIGPQTINGLSFEEILHQKTHPVRELKFSKHAENRLNAGSAVTTVLGLSTPNFFNSSNDDGSRRVIRSTRLSVDFTLLKFAWFLTGPMPLA